MPKVNSRFFICPGCKQSNRFKKDIFVVFLHNEEHPNEPSIVYQNEVEYRCTICGHVAKKETING